MSTVNDLVTLLGLRSFGKLNLSVVNLEGVADEMKKQLDNLTESKGVKAHFRLDESGLINLDNVRCMTIWPPLILLVGCG